MTDVWLGCCLGVLHWWLFRFSVVCLQPGASSGPKVLSALALGRYWLVGLLGAWMVFSQKVSGRDLGLGLLIVTLLYLLAQVVLGLVALKVEKKV